MRFLVVEDNAKLANLIRKALTEQNYTVTIANTAREARKSALADSYDGIILDLMLPDQDGVELCKHLRDIGVTTPILMLTALSLTSDKIRGLDAGADDYLTKPFEFDELIARSRALLRRAQPVEGSVLRFDDLEMDLIQRQVTRGGRHIELTSREFALLEYFMRSPDRVISRSRLGEHVWDMEFEDESNVIEVYVSRLRGKVDKGYAKNLIHTVVGAGYVLSQEPRDN